MGDEVGSDLGGWRLGMGIPVGQNTVPSAEGPWQLCWLSVSLGAKAAGVLCRAGPSKPWSLPLHGSVFFPVPSCPYKSSFAGLWGKTEEDPSCSAPKGWGSWLLTLLFPFQGELCLAGEFPLGAEQHWFGGKR